MEYLDNYIVSLDDIKNQEIHFDYEIGKEFFACFDNEEVNDGKLICSLDITKEPRMYVFAFKIEGYVVVTCDRCLDEFNFELDDEYELMVKLGSVNEEETEDVVIISSNTKEINVAQYIYEYIHLSLPLKKIHPEDESGKSLCNQEMVKKLEELSQNVTETPKDDEIDPRWNDLKNLNFN